jgi:hypothetical protein
MKKIIISIAQVCSALIFSLDDCSASHDKSNLESAHATRVNKQATLVFPKEDLFKKFESARNFVRKSDPSKAYAIIKSLGNKDLKPSHFKDFHKAYKLITEPGHTYKEYQDSYFCALLLSGFISKQICLSFTGKSDEIKKMAKYYSSIAYHLDLIKRQVRHPMSFVFENLFARNRKQGSMVSVMKEPYNAAHHTAVKQDPLNRDHGQLGQLLAQWNQSYVPGMTPPFQLWLLQKSGATNMPLFKYAGSFAYKHNVAKILKDGSINKPDGEYNYIYKRGKIYLHSTKEPHDLIAGSNPVECAGEMTIVGKKIKVISNRSGHFMPTPFHLLKAVKKFKKFLAFHEDASGDFYYKNERMAWKVYRGEDTKIATMDSVALHNRFRTLHHYCTKGWLGRNLDLNNVGIVFNASTVKKFVPQLKSK